MSTYVIGDVQGCFDELQALLAHIQFNPEADTLWFTGDLVNRGPKSLETLRFIKSLPSFKVVLGNHDLHLLAVHYGKAPLRKDDTLDTILNATDREELIDWLRHQPLFYFDRDKGYAMAHAGLAPAWTLSQAGLLAQEVEGVLKSQTPAYFFEHMYGNQPDGWHDDLRGWDRLRCITNYFTRMRFCYADGRLDLAYKGEISGKPANLIPWFDLPNRVNAHVNILFGHWAALNGTTDAPNIYPLDTGCVWGNCLTALRLEDGKRFSVKCG